MDLIIAREAQPEGPTRTEEASRDLRLARAAEDALLAAVEDLVRSNRGMERAIRMVAYHPTDRPWGMSQRRIFDLTGINRKRIKRILDTIEG